MTAFCDESVTQFFVEAREFPLLSAEKEKTLALAIAGGDREAFDQLIMANVRLVGSIARRYVRSGIPLEDLLQEGMLGLMRAAEKFDASKGFRFSTYATWWVRQYIARALPDLERHISLPVHAQDDLLAMHRLILKTEIATGETPTAQDIAKALHKKLDYIEALQQADMTMASLDEPLRAEGDAPVSLAAFLEDVNAVSPEDAILDTSLSDTVQDALESLPHKQRDVIRRRFGLEPYDCSQTFEEIAKAYQCSKQRIGQLETEAKRKLRKTLASVAREELAS